MCICVAAMRHVVGCCVLCNWKKVGARLGFCVHHGLFAIPIRPVNLQDLKVGMRQHLLPSEMLLCWQETVVHQEQILAESEQSLQPSLLKMLSSKLNVAKCDDLWCQVMFWQCNKRALVRIESREPHSSHSFPLVTFYYFVRSVFTHNSRDMCNIVIAA